MVKNNILLTVLLASFAAPVMSMGTLTTVKDRFVDLHTAHPQVADLGAFIVAFGAFNKGAHLVGLPKGIELRTRHVDSTSPENSPVSSARLRAGARGLEANNESQSLAAGAGAASEGRTSPDSSSTPAVVASSELGTSLAAAAAKQSGSSLISRILRSELPAVKVPGTEQSAHINLPSLTLITVASAAVTPTGITFISNTVSNLLIRLFGNRA